MELDGIFMDLYGTLTDGDRIAVETVCGDVVAQTGVALTAHELSVAWGRLFFNAIESANGDGFLTLFDLELKTLREIMAAYGVTIDPRPHVEKLAAYWQKPPLHVEVRDALARVKYPVCIVSNADQFDAESALAAHDIEVDLIVTSEQARHYKPHPEIFEVALKKTGWRRDRVIHIGDSLHSDVGGARAAGIRHGWLNRVGRIFDVGTHEADHEFPDLHGVVNFLHGEPPGERSHVD